MMMDVVSTSGIIQIAYVKSCWIYLTNGQTGTTVYLLLLFATVLMYCLCTDLHARSKTFVCQRLWPRAECRLLDHISMPQYNRWYCVFLHVCNARATGAVYDRIAFMCVCLCVVKASVQILHCTDSIACVLSCDMPVFIYNTVSHDCVCIGIG